MFVTIWPKLNKQRHPCQKVKKSQFAVASFHRHKYQTLPVVAPVAHLVS